MAFYNKMKHFLIYTQKKHIKCHKYFLKYQKNRKRKNYP